MPHPRWHLRRLWPVARVVCGAMLLVRCSSARAHHGPDGMGALVSAADIAAREQTADQQVQHVLNRLAFGPRPDDVATVRAMGVDAWIARQLEPERVSDEATTQFIAQFTSLDKTGETLLADFPPAGVALAALARRAGGRASAEDSAEVRKQGRQANAVLSEINISRVARAMMSERQLNEVMVDFWENHFTVFAGKDRTRYFIPEYDAQTIRPHALGKFRDLLGAVAHSPAMLVYLDNWQSVADSGRTTLRDLAARPRVAARRAVARRGAVVAPPARGAAVNAAVVAPRRRGLNENYARELMELHTLGVDGGYTQQDVIEVARALTGWTLSRGANGGAFVFRPEVHDAQAKVILGHKFPAGRGQEEGEAVLDLLAQHPATARFIALKLARRFVSDTPPAALVERAANTFRKTDGDIREVVRTIVTSQEFFASSAYRAKVKSPFELVISTMRALNVKPDSTPRTAQLVAALGEPIFGHQAPNGYPETGDAWMNTGAILSRINFGMRLATGPGSGARLASWPATKTLVTQPREAQVDGVIRTLLGGSVSTDTRQVLLTGTNPFLAARAAAGDTSNLAGIMGDSGRDSTANATATARPSRMSALLGLSQIVGLALGAPEFQRR